MKERIAVISPSNILTDKAIEISNQRNINLKIIESAQLDAHSIGKSLERDGIKIIITRGNTANVLRENLNIPIVDIRHTFFSCYTSYMRAKKISNKIAFLATSQGYEDVLKKYKPFLKDAIVYQVNPVLGNKEVDARLNELSKLGIEVLIGGLSLEKDSIEHGFKYIMTSCDGESINLAIEESIHLLKIIEERDEKNLELQNKYEMINSILNCTSDGIISVDQHGVVTQINDNAKEFLKHTCVGGLTSSKVSELFNESLKKCKNIFGELITIDDKPLIININLIQVNKSVVGAVATLQRQAQIQDMEQKIRKKLVSKGHIAESTFDDILGKSEEINSVKRLANRYANTDSTILILGETGTGKELFAHSIHNASKRAKGPFVAINCAAFPKSTLESELFGYVKGAFTGALSEGKPGLFELAHNGTIFLDEISEIPLEVQIKLLRVIQERKVMRIGDDKIKPIDVRIITASNKNLQELVEKNLFREDFYYRICVLELDIPPLRERKGDMPLLINHFLKNEKLPNHKISEEAIDILEKDEWKGNIRQLKNTIERIAIMCEDEIITKHLVLKANKSTNLKNKANEIHIKENIENKRKITTKTEREYIKSVLCETKGNKKDAANILGISTTTLWRKIKKILDEDPNFLETVKYGF